jgi:RimJ/RimL family protein N-acetyltransferase
VFEVLGFSKVTAGYLASNVGMHKAFMKNGFTIEGILRRQVFFAGQLVDHVLVGKLGGVKSRSTRQTTNELVQINSEGVER